MPPEEAPLAEHLAFVASVLATLDALPELRGMGCRIELHADAATESGTPRCEVEFCSPAGDPIGDIGEGATASDAVMEAVQSLVREEPCI